MTARIRCESRPAAWPAASWRSVFITGLISLLLLMSPVAVNGQSAEPPAPELQSPLPTAEAIQGRIDGIPADNPQAAPVLAELQRALAATINRSRFVAKTGEYDALIAGAAQHLDQTRIAYERSDGAASIDLPDPVDIDALEHHSTIAAAAVEEQRRIIEELLGEKGRRTARRRVISERLIEIGTAIGQLESTPEPIAAGQPELDDAHRLALDTERAALLAEQESLERERASYDARSQLLPARHDLAVQRLAELESAAELWRAELTRKRSEAAHRAEAEARQLRIHAAAQHPILQELAESNEELIAIWSGPQGIASRLDQVAEDLAASRSQLSDLRVRSAESVHRVKVTGLARATGYLLRHEYHELPSSAAMRREINRVRRQLMDAEDNRLDYEDGRRSAGNLDSEVDRLLVAIKADTPDHPLSEELRAVALELVVARRDQLDQLVAAYTSYVERLGDLDGQLSTARTETDAYRDFLAERILWVRSVRDPLPDFATARTAVTHLVDPGEWRELAVDAREGVAARWATLLPLSLVLFILIGARHHTKLALGARAAAAAKYETDVYRLTLDAVILTLLLSTALPGALLLIAAVLRAGATPTDFSLSMAASLIVTAIVVAPIEFVRNTTRTGGLAVVHFRWPKEAIRCIRRQLRWFMPVAVGASILLSLVGSHKDDVQHETLGRLIFVVLQLVLIYLLARLYRPKSGIMAPAFARRHPGWIVRLHRIWYPLVLIIPAALAALTTLGYFYTAGQLGMRLLGSALLGLSLLFVHAMLIRWLFLARRRVAVEDVRRRRQAEAERQEGDEPVPESRLDFDRVNIPAMDAQTQSLFRSAIAVAVLIGLATIWSPVLPALKRLDRVQLWPQITLLESSNHAAVVVAPPNVSPGASTADPEAPSPTSFIAPGLNTLSASTANRESTEFQNTSITLADLSLAILILLATVVSTRNVPGVVEIALLQHLPMDSGSRYALKTIIRYLLMTIGLIVAFMGLGVSWSHLQWLVAALTFGLAFGLQEIFANFISGLIMLVERPVRVGDTVTVGDIHGTVTRIQMRATTVLDWDNKELIVPNKLFITTNVINWSLTDSLLRVIIDVGCSYSSDSRQVERLLLDIANTNDRIMKQPAPTVIFRRFGDSTLDFELRVFIPSVESQFPVRDELHHVILERFRTDGIEIAFPQRDLHVRSIEGLPGLTAAAPDADG